MGHAAAVAHGVEPGDGGHQVAVHLHPGIVELHFHAVEQGVFVGGAGGYLVQGVDHLDDGIQLPLGDDQRQVAGGGLQGGPGEAFFHAPFRGAAALDQVAEALQQHAAAQHVGQAGDVLAVAVGVGEGRGEAVGHQQGEIGVFRVQGRVGVGVAVHGDDAVGVLGHHLPVGVHAEGAHQVVVLVGLVDDLAFVDLVRDVLEHLRRQLHPDADIHPVAGAFQT